MSSTPSLEPKKKSNCILEFCSQHRTRIALSSFYFFYETCFSFKMFFMPVYWQQLGLSPTQIGILRAVWGVAYSSGGVVFGKMASKWKIRRALLIMSVLSTAVTPLVSLVPRRTHDKCLVVVGKNLTENKRHMIASQEGKNSFHRSDALIKSRGVEEKPDVLEHFISRRSLPPITKRTPREAPLSRDHVLILEKSPQDINTIFLIFVFIVFVGELLASPAFSLANSESVDYLGENSRDFGKIRLWGPIGHMIAAPTTALFVTHYHYMLCGEYQDNFAFVFTVIFIMALTSLVSVTQFGDQAIEHSDNTEENGDGKPLTLLDFFSRYQNIVFIVMTFLIGCFDGVVLTFGFWYTKTLDVTIATLVFGFSRMTSSAVSVVFLGFTGLCVKKTGYTGVIVFSMMLFVTWFVGMSLMKNPWLMLLFETVGYTAYVTGFTGLISYFGEVTPTYLMDTVQGGVNSLFLGVGCGVGTALCGFFIDAFGAIKAFQLFASGEAVLLVLFIISQATYFCLKMNEKEEKRKLLE
ncbi:major facilitator superfamily domain-containing protein 6-like isoform X2 [Stylophora pistillata]|nr:major facilitator superfamily domain-containing protein 6-like isoform X2 [Stylophora pistillata]XP_022785249.1 major facilitator superfamily domain-containing protein 6-like isoform X2 [Stylophora pistillata]